MVRRDAGLREHVAKDAQCFQSADAPLVDRAPGHRLQFGGRARAVEGRRVEAHAVDGVPHDRLGQHLGGRIMLMHGA